MNKKKYITFCVIGLFAMVFVTAGIMDYYGQINTTVKVTQPISLGYFEDNELIFFTYGVFEEEINVMAGDSIDGKSIRVQNFADTERTFKVEEVSNVKGISVIIHTDMESFPCPFDGNQITPPAGSVCYFTIEYTAHPMLEPGNYTIATQILPA